MYNKYYEYKKQVTYNSGQTWSDTGEYTPSGATIGTYDTLEECSGGTINYKKKYFTIVTVTECTVKFNYATGANYFYYSIDGGYSWIGHQSGTTITMDSNSKILVKGYNNSPGVVDGDLGNFTTTGNFSVEGNIMSLFYGDNFSGETYFPTGGGNQWIFTPKRLFKDCTGLISAENLILPKSSQNGCYRRMFENCTSLTTPPELPATTLANSCYYGMFSNCTSLTTVPSNMLQATTLANSCYYGMFSNCTSLTTAPILSATTLENFCYCRMFEGCTSLTTAPNLPATTLKQSCYASMFSGCTSLDSITSLATDIAATNCTTNWVNGVAASGTFYKNSSMSSWSTGDSGIPSGWTVQNYSS